MNQVSHMQTFEQSTTFQPSVLAAAWRYRALVAGIAMLGALGALAFLNSRPPQYVATATAVFEAPGETLLLPASSSTLLERFVGTQMQILQSGTVALRASQMAKESGFDVSPGEIVAGLQLTNLRNTDVVSIAFASSDPDEAVGGAGALIAAYSEVRRDQRTAEASDILERLDGAARVIDEDISDVGARLSAIVVGSATRGDLDDQLGTLTDNLMAQQRQLSSTTDAEEIARINRNIGDIVGQLQALQLVIDLTDEQPSVASLLQEQQVLLSRRADLAERRNQVEIEAETAGSGFEFVSSAALTNEPSGAGPMFTALGGLFLGGLVGLAVAYYVGQLRRSFTYRGEPEAVLDRPFLAEIPDFADEDLKTQLPVRDAPRSASAEAFRFATANLDIRLENPDHRTVAVVSSVVGEGKSVITANLAMAAARSGRRVLIMDADFGNQQLGALLHAGMALQPGLTEVVELKTPIDRCIVKIKAGASNEVHLLGRGLRPVVAPDFFKTSEATSVFADLTSAYDLVLIDTPPLLQVAYASSLVRLADQVVVIVPHQSAVRTLEDTAERLRFLGAVVAGYVYNRAPLRREMMMSEGSMKDVLGDRGLKVHTPSRSQK